MKPDIRDTPCPLHHAEGRKACAVVFDVGGDSEGAFCGPRLEAALAAAWASRDRDIIERCAVEAEKYARGSGPTRSLINGALFDAAARIRALSPAGTAPALGCVHGRSTGALCPHCTGVNNPLMVESTSRFTDPRWQPRPAGTAVPEVCGTCHGAGYVLFLWPRPGSPPGNYEGPCPACSPGGER